MSTIQISEYGHHLSPQTFHSFNKNYLGSAMCWEYKHEHTDAICALLGLSLVGKTDMKQVTSQKAVPLQYKCHSDVEDAKNRMQQRSPTGKLGNAVLME